MGIGVESPSVYKPSPAARAHRGTAVIVAILTLFTAPAREGDALAGGAQESCRHQSVSPNRAP